MENSNLQLSDFINNSLEKLSKIQTLKTDRNRSLPTSFILKVLSQKIFLSVETSKINIDKIIENSFENFL